MQPTKQGLLFTLDRTTGAPVIPVEERPTPQGGAPGETLSPTQPFPVAPAPLAPSVRKAPPPRPLNAGALPPPPRPRPPRPPIGGREVGAEERARARVRVCVCGVCARGEGVSLRVAKKQTKFGV